MKKTLLFLMTIGYLGLFAQITDLDITYRLLEEEGRLQEQLDWQKQATDDFYANREDILNRQMNVVYQVPCVVHIIWDNANGTNITDAQVDIMMDNLNKDYARTNDDVGVTRAIWDGVVSAVDLQFCLVRTDPDGNPTTGITRTETTHGQFNPQNTAPNPDTGENIKSTANGGIDAWDTHRFMNIWIGDLTGGTGMGVVGYSTLPGSHGLPNDGFIMDVVAVANENLDRTPTHEIGHYFGLLHTWGNDCNTDGDGIADTPITMDDHLGLGCGTAPDDCPADAFPDQFENFMDYSNCTNMFTVDQAAFMKANLEGARASLLAEDLCILPELTADFTPNTPIITINAGETVTFTDASTSPTGITTWNWTFQGGISASPINAEGPHVVTYNTPGLFDVSLSVADDNGNESKTVTDLVQVIDVLNANFMADITYVPIGDNVTFTDLTSGPEDLANWSWAWDFGDATTDMVQHPVKVYNTVGTYTVELVINDGVNTDTETKIEYIEVFDPLLLNIIDFVGNPLTINSGETVEFEVNCNQADADIDSVRWFFESANTPTQLFDNTNSFDIEYNIGGIFDVECRVYRNNGTDGDTLIKQNYIVVISPDSVPDADFVASNSNFPLGTPPDINFTNLSNVVNSLDSVRWFIQTAANTTIESTDIHPLAVPYAEIGDFDVKLIIYSPFGVDSIEKENYIHVFDPTDLGSISTNFEAVTVRLITVGESVQFQDLSEGDILSWVYSFDRGAGTSEIEYNYNQNPSQQFQTEGIYKVSLIASNTNYADTVSKMGYVIVTSTPWPGGPAGYCDTLTNIKVSEDQMTFRNAQAPHWGIFPGHYAVKSSPTSSEEKIKRYAEKFTTYDTPQAIPDGINAIVFSVARAYSGDPEATIRIQVWNADEFGKPKDLLTGYSKDKIRINTLQAGLYNYVELEETIPVDSVFFIGFRLDYETTTSAQDTFAVFMAPERPNTEDNTVYVSKDITGGVWKTPTDFLGFELNTSMAMEVMGCVVNVPEVVELEASVNVYPNPATDKLNIDFGDYFIKDINIEMYDVVGKKVSSQEINETNNIFELDLENCNNGFYLVNITVNGFQVTKKVLIQK